jgi:hypothetical protein
MRKKIKKRNGEPRKNATRHNGKDNTNKIGYTTFINLF